VDGEVVAPHVDLPDDDHLLHVLEALLARHAPEDLRGSAFGLFNLASGVALLVASVLAGLLWDAWGPRSTFLAGAAFTAVAWVGLALRQRR